jgi:5-methylcytosine-specific restriction endonuclease McrA
MNRSKSLLKSKVLVLNRSFLPVHITNVQRAMVLLYQGAAEAVDEEYRTYSFEEWCEADVSPERIGLVNKTISVPRVIVVRGFERIPRRYVRFSRSNVYIRDNHTCQYCGKRLPRSELNLDHVNPKSQGGQSSWENVVCSCHRCNRRKGGRTPEQAKLKLLRKPQRPSWTPYVAEVYGNMRYWEWSKFLGFDKSENKMAS